MDNIHDIVECIHLSTTDNIRKAYSTQVLDQIRLSSERYNIGLRLFVESNDYTAKFFGLSLIRDWMQIDLIRFLSKDTCDTSYSTLNGDSLKAIRENIRNVTFTWMINLLSNSEVHLHSIPYYLISNVISVLTLSLKFDFPILWPSAFHDILNLGYTYDLYGIDIVTKILKELEIEVVMYNEHRTKEEVAQNVIVKDAMRDSSIMKDIVQFLCNSAQHTYHEEKANLCVTCLQCLAELIGWVDVNLIIENALPVIYQLWQQPIVSPMIRAEACTCLYELVKKGMDPILKVKLTHSIGLIPIITSDVKTRHILSNQIILCDEDEIVCLSMLGQLISILVTEYIGCWCKYEEHLVDLIKLKNHSSDSSNVHELIETIPIVVASLDSLLPMLLQVFNMHHSLKAVASSVLPACNRLVHLLKFQQQREISVVYLSEQRYQSQGIVFFHAQPYLVDLLRGIYLQSHFPDDFDYIEEGEDELSEEVQLKAEVRKLFINCCRIHPDKCLEMITAAMNAQSQPFSKASVSSLDAALRLVYAFSELGPTHMKFISESSFPALISALQQTDIVHHKNPQIVLNYFEISLRYIKYLGISDVMNLATALLGKNGIQNKNKLICNRAAYCFLKVSENFMLQQWNILEFSQSIYPQLSDILLQASSIGTSSLFTRPPLLTDQSELYLCEAASLITSNNSNPDEKYQLGDLIAIQLNQIQRNMNMFDHHPQLQEQIYIEITQRINSLCGLSKGYSYKSHPDKVEYFENATKAMVIISKKLCVNCSMLRAKVLVFLHRMVHCMGKAIIMYDQEIIPVLLQNCNKTEIVATPNEVVQIINQLMMEFESDCEGIVNLLLCMIINKYRSLSTALEATSSSSSLEAPHVQSERLALHHQYLLFIQHVVCYQCSSALFSQSNIHELDGIFSVVLTGLSGGFVTSNTQDSIPVRKTSLIILHNLVLYWLLANNHFFQGNNFHKNDFITDHSINVPDQIISLFKSFLYDKALPTAFHTISSCIPTALISSKQMKDDRQINVNDAASQSVLIELSVLFRYSYIALQITGDRNSTRLYFEQLCCNILQWPIEIVTSLLELVQENTTPLGTFKENFKKFIRNCTINKHT